MDTFDRIEKLLRQHSMSQADLSRATGISTGLISQWKKRSQTPSIQKLSLIAEHFNVSIEYLLNGEEKPAAGAGSGVDILDEVDVAFYGEYKELDDRDKEAVRDFVRVMRERRAREGK